MAFGLSAGAVSLIGMGAGALLSGSSGGSSQSGTSTATTQQQVDPRIQSMLFGNGTQRLKPGVTPTWTSGQPDASGRTWDAASNPQSDYTSDTGLLGQYQGMLSTPQSAGSAAYGGAAQNYIGSPAAQSDLASMRGAANGLMGSSIGAPQSQGAQAQAYQTGQMAQASGAQAGQHPGTNATMSGASQINAPAQNGMNLSGSYDRFINGAPGANPFLTGAIGKGINQSNNAFGAMQRDSTKNLLENVMPSIRSNSVLSGQYGGSRQGIAEGRALDTFATEQQRAMSQFGQNNTDAAVSAQAGAYDADSNRALGATQGLGAQQYGVASQNASMAQQASLANQGASNTASMFNSQQNQNTTNLNANLQQSNSQYNAGLAQQGSQFNTGALNNNSQFNAGLAQQTGISNAQFQGQANALNSSNQQAGLSAQNGLLNNQIGAAQNQDNWALSHAQGVNGLLSPYIGVNGNTTSSTPLYSNTAGNVLGGATAGIALGKQLGGLLGSSTGGSVASSAAYGDNNWFSE